MRPAAQKTTEPPKAADVCQRFTLGDDARELLHPDDDVDYYFSALMENMLFTDAIRFTAHRLSKREAVWWGCLCAWEVCRDKPTGPVSAALRACALWVKEPKDENRRAAQSVADAALGTPAGNLALAVFLSGGSMAPADCPPVAPPAGVSGRLVAEAVLHASRLAEQTIACQQRFLGIAAEIASGRLSTGPAARPTS